MTEHDTDAGARMKQIEERLSLTNPSMPDDVDDMEWLVARVKTLEAERDRLKGLLAEACAIIDMQQQKWGGQFHYPERCECPGCQKARAFLARVKAEGGGHV